MNHLNDSGAFAMEYDAIEDTFLVLATDSSNNYILFQVTASLEYENKIYAIEEEVMGVTLTAEPKIYLAYPIEGLRNLQDRLNNIRNQAGW